VSISERQGQRLGLKARSQWSPYLEKCCLLVSANESYQRAAEDIATLTGITVSSSTQQRLVHRQGWAAPEVDCGVKEMSLDGGKVRLRTPLGEPSVWRDYKAWLTDKSCLSKPQRLSSQGFQGSSSSSSSDRHDGGSIPVKGCALKALCCKPFRL
jgi:hypothetical protein